jgi:hypothetical protein
MFKTNNLRKVTLKICCSALIYVFCLPLDNIQAQEPLIIARITEKITLDGLVNESVWQKIKPLPVVMYIPNNGQEPTERTEIFLAYDDDNLYIASRFYDSEPDKIQYPSKKRDEGKQTSDWLGLNLDTFNDNENNLLFGTTPAGLRSEVAISNDGENYNFSWNTFWDVATYLDEKGWYAELQIPFSSLRFQDVNGRVVMGLIVWRYISRKNEIDIFPAIPSKWGNNGPNKPSLAYDIVFEGIQRRNPIYLTPYILGGMSNSNTLNESKTFYNGKKENKFDAGLDVKMGLTNNLTMDLTLNTDFAQVEADDQQINLTRFSLYFPEKRLFFQERASVFDFSFGGQTKIFYSRKIGLYEGKPIRIFGGARLIGRIGDWDVGFINMQTEKSEKLPSENFSVLRLKKQVLNQYSYIGGIATTRIGTNGNKNFVYGLDGKLRLSDDDEILINWGQCFDNTAQDILPFFDISRFRLGWERRSIEGVGLLINLVRRGNDFKPGIGFEAFNNYEGIASRIKYGWLSEKESPLQSHYIFYDGYELFRNTNNALLTMAAGFGWGFITKSGATGEYSVIFYRERLADNFSISKNVSVPKGSYTFVGVKGNYQTPEVDLLSSLFSCEAGMYYDGMRFSFKAEPSWYVSPDINLSGGYEFNHINFSSRNKSMNSHILRLKILTTLTTTFSASAFVQFNSINKTIIPNLRLRYNPKEGTDIYLVYNDELNIDRYREHPVLPAYNFRSIQIKCTYTFDL